MKVKVNFKDIAKDTELFVHGLPPLKNGHEVTLSKEQVEFWQAMNGIEEAPATLVLDDVDRPSKHPSGDESESTPVADEEHAPVDSGKKEK